MALTERWESFDNRIEFSEKFLAGFGQCNASGRTIEQADAEMLFQ